MYIKKCGDRYTTKVKGNIVPYIVINGIDETGVANSGFSTRKGGVSQGIFESMNFSEKMGDTKENVIKNYEIFSDNTIFSNFVITDQTHTTNIKYVNSENSWKGITSPLEYKDIDGLITDDSNITLTTFYADCVPLYFVDTVKKTIGLAHAGWKGTVNRIAASVLDEMKMKFGTKSKDVVAAIGPSICVNCYEVSEDVANEFINKMDLNTNTIKDYDECIDKNNIVHDMNNIIYKKREKYMLNLWAANYKIFIDSGILPENIYITDTCTCCNKEVLFSHRGLKGKRGNLAAFLKLKNGGEYGNRNN